MEFIYSQTLINTSFGEYLTTREQAEFTDFRRELTFCASKPDGTMHRMMDVSRINAMGWKYKVQLKEGFALSYQDMLSKS